MSLQKAQELGASSVADGSIWKPLEVEAQLEAAGPGEPVVPSELCPVLGQTLLTLPSTSSVQSPSILRPPPSCPLSPLPLSPYQLPGDVKLTHCFIAMFLFFVFSSPRLRSN